MKAPSNPSLQQRHSSSLEKFHQQLNNNTKSVAQKNSGRMASANRHNKQPINGDPQ